MSKTQPDTRLVIDTCETRRVSLGEDPAAYVYPVELHAPGGLITVGGFDEKDFSIVPDDISVELVNEGLSQVVDLPALTTQGVASYIRSARWGQPEVNCMTFAWQVSGVTDERLSHEADFHELESADELAPGDLLSVGTITHPMGLLFLEETHMIHWGIYLADEIALNVTGRAGILAATPLENFGAIYPGTNTYKITDYAA